MQATEADALVEAARWETPRWLQLELDAETRRLLDGGQESELAAIYTAYKDNSRRTWELYEVSRKRFQQILKARFIEYVLTCHTEGVSLAVRVGKSQNELFGEPFADRFLPIRLFFDVERGPAPNGGGIPLPKQKPESKQPAKPAPKGMRAKLGRGKS